MAKSMNAGELAAVLARHPEREVRVLGTASGRKRVVRIATYMENGVPVWYILQGARLPPLPPDTELRP